jgi:flagellar hook-basal body complex protein FliE
MSPIRAVEVPTAAIESVRGPREAGTAAGANGESFASTLADAVQGARMRERAASEAAAGFAAGDPAVGIHEVVIAAEKANVSLRYATTLKNKLLDAYRELMSTQV